jgi:VIT1/CCC1 family predicted Fe2+/Mn2+ transporter|tara:strand:+ start:569 stop:763 length:195 start_codon:yes stop_codon:yes gene_type:complete
MKTFGDKEIREIIERKKKGIDNTEKESGYIKGYIKDNKGKVNKEIIDLFNAEYGESLEEMAKNN